MKKFFIILISLFFIVCVWIFSIRTPWKLVAGQAELTPFELSYTKEDFVLGSQCHGFTGQCEFPQFGLKLELLFSGLKIRKPTYRLSLSGGNDGFILGQYYFGTRTLIITHINGEVVKFEQFLWNASVHAGFTDLVQFRTERNELFIPTDFAVPGMMSYKLLLRGSNSR